METLAELLILPIQELIHLIPNGFIIDRQNENNFRFLLKYKLEIFKMFNYNKKQILYFKSFRKLIYLFDLYLIYIEKLF